MPKFARGMVKKIYNEYTMERGITEISAEVMNRARSELGLEEMQVSVACDQDLTPRRDAEQANSTQGSSWRRRMTAPARRAKDAQLGSGGVRSAGQVVLGERKGERRCLMTHSDPRQSRTHLSSKSRSGNA